MYLRRLWGGGKREQQTGATYGCILYVCRIKSVSTEYGFGLRPRLYAGPVCDAQHHSSCSVWLLALCKCCAFAFATCDADCDCTGLCT